MADHDVRQKEMNCYILADGFDLEDCAALITERAKRFIFPYTGRILFINERIATPSPSSDYPDWHLGIQFQFEALNPSERRDVILFFHQLSFEIGRAFVFGGRAAKGGESEDWHFIDANSSIDPVLNFVTKRNEN